MKQKSAIEYAYLQLLIQQSAIHPGSVFNRHGGSIFNRREHTVIVSGSVAENVRYGDLQASDADVRAACDAAHVTEFASMLPSGLDTELGERGVRLSGGQRQRVAIAILANCPVLLLDEATSALDAESEGWSPTPLLASLENTPRSSSRIGCPPCKAPTASSSSTKAVWSRRAHTRS